MTNLQHHLNAVKSAEKGLWVYLNTLIGKAIVWKHCGYEQFGFVLLVSPVPTSPGLKVKNDSTQKEVWIYPYQIVYVEGDK